MVGWRDEGGQRNLCGEDQWRWRNADDAREPCRTILHFIPSNALSSFLMAIGEWSWMNSKRIMLLSRRSRLL